jgi:Zn-finger nucleic acid-binding protein
MENLTCPRCGVEMVTRTLAGSVGGGDYSQCPEGHGVFLARPDLGSLIEAENDWHRNASQQTAPIPRITPDMQTPPASRVPARAWIETLFG